jgi:ethanolamine utilization protein EutQ (cupin superfamily)
MKSRTRSSESIVPRTLAVDDLDIIVHGGVTIDETTGTDGGVNVS